jgi:formylmethanofuran dehydrogenase subunit E
VAATFVDLKTNRAFRVVAREESKKKARELYPEMEKEQGQQRAYRELPDEDLFRSQWVRVDLPPEEMPGYKAPRVACDECGEGINFKREVQQDSRLLCRACAGDRYYKPLQG